MDHIGTIELQTDRLILRRLTLEDAEEMYRNWASDDEVTKYLTWRSHADVQETLAYLQHCVQGYQDLSFYQWGIELKDTHALIGNISVVRVEEEAERLELGWVIGRSFWGNGYTAEAGKEVLKVLFDRVEAKNIVARHDVNNPNSGRVMQKMGMKFGGISRQCATNNQGIVDCAYYSIAK